MDATRHPVPRRQPRAQRRAAESEVRGTALAAVRQAFVPTGARVAVLVSNTFQYGTTRQFSVLSVEASAAVEPFYDVDDALRWLSATEQRMKRRPRRR